MGRDNAADIERYVERVHAEGGCAALITLTVRHHAAQPLAWLWDGITQAWSRVTSGRRYVAEWERFGVTGWVGTVEAPHGDAGWHPHRHVLVTFDTLMSLDMVTAMAEQWWDRWEAALRRFGLGGIEHRGGLDVRMVRPGSSGLGEYLSKIAFEVSGHPTKTGRGESRTPFEVLASFDATGNADDHDLWVEFERAAQRRKTITWARGTRERFGLGRERSAEEIVEDDAGGDNLIGLPAETWHAVRDRSEDLLAAAERDGVGGAEAWLRVRGLSFTRVSPADWADAGAAAARAEHARVDWRRLFRGLGGG